VTENRSVDRAFSSEDTVAGWIPLIVIVAWLLLPRRLRIPTVAAGTKADAGEPHEAASHDHQGLEAQQGQDANRIAERKAG
jgi:hypothetical protein